MYGRLPEAAGNPISAADLVSVADLACTSKSLVYPADLTCTPRPNTCQMGAYRAKDGRIRILQ